MKLYDPYGRAHIATIQKDFGTFAVYVDDNYVDNSYDKTEAEKLLRDYATEHGLSFSKPNKRQRKTVNA